MHVFLQERGIREYRQGRGRALAYDDADEMYYSSLRIFMHGSYIHTLQKVGLNPITTRAGRSYARTSLRNPTACALAKHGPRSLWYVTWWATRSPNDC